METNKTDGNNILSVALERIKLPQFQEKLYNGKPYVKYGIDNMFPNLLQELANKSALHNAIISSKVDYAYGSGLELCNPYNEKRQPDLPTQLFVNHPNPYEDLNSIYRKCLYDYILYGGFALNIIWSKDRENISEIYHIDFSKIRCGRKDEREQVTTYYWCDDWKSVQRIGYKEITAYNPNKRQGSQLLYCKLYKPGTFYYPLPSYVGALNYCAIDAEISNFHLAHILNGMSPNIMISFVNGIPTEEERKKIKNQLIEEFTGSDNAGKFFVTFSEDNTKVPVITPISADNLDEQFLQLQDTVLQNILSGHQIVSPVLVGIKSDGISFGSGEELKNAYEIFTNTVIKPIQKLVVDTLNNIIRMTFNYSGTEVRPTTEKPISFTFSENVLQQIMTKDELREKAGLSTTIDE